jgi:protein ImuB
MPPSRTGSRTSLCLWLPTFELRLELVRVPELDETSVALLMGGGEGGGGSEGGRWDTGGRRFGGSGSGGRGSSAARLIHQVSERAWEAGVRPGMTVSRAVTLCPSLTLLEPDPAHYDAAMDEILEALEGMSPVVEPVERGLIHVGVDGLGRLHGSPRNQVDRALHLLLEVLPRTLVAAIRAGRAPGTFGAWVAAASAHPGRPVLIGEEELIPFLAARPVSSLPVSEVMAERLKRLGIRTLEELARIPLPALLRQFGPEGREARALARGERIDPVRPLHRPRPIRVSLDFPAPVGERQALHRGVDRLLERGLARPERKGRSIRALRAGGHLEGGGSWQVEATLREPLALREALASPLRGRISLSPPPRALETLFVEFFDFGAPATQASLFGRREKGAREVGGAGVGGAGAGEPGVGGAGTEGTGGKALREAVRELTLRLGHSPLYRVVEVDPWSRIPERRHALLPLEP